MDVKGRLDDKKKDLKAMEVSYAEKQQELNSLGQDILSMRGAVDELKALLLGIELDKKDKTS